MSDTLVAALIGGVFTIAGSVAAVYVQRHFEARRPRRPSAPPPHPAAPPTGAGAPPSASSAAAGRNAKAIAAAAVGVFGLMVGEPVIGLLCAGLALWLGRRSLAETGAASGQKGRGLAWTGMALGALAGLGSFADMLMPSPSPLLLAPMLYPY
jgi:hypothetical protein